MTWRARFRRSGARKTHGSVAGSGEGISLETKRVVDLGPVRDLYALLEAIDRAMADGDVLYVEGTNIGPEIRAFLEANAAEEARPIARGTLLPRPTSYHLSLSGPTLGELRELAQGRAEPEICDHLVVYRGDEVILSAYDAGSGHVYVSVDLPAETVEGLRRGLGMA